MVRPLRPAAECAVSVNVPSSLSITPLPCSVAPWSSVTVTVTLSSGFSNRPAALVKPIVRSLVPSSLMVASRPANPRLSACRISSSVIAMSVRRKLGALMSFSLRRSVVGARLAIVFRAEHNGSSGPAERSTW